MTNSWIRKADQVHEGAADLAARLGKMFPLLLAQPSVWSTAYTSERTIRVFDEESIL